MDAHERRLRRLRLDAREQLEDAETTALELARATRTLREALLDEARQGCEIHLEFANGDRSGHGLATFELRGVVEHVGDEVIRVCAADGQRTDVVIGALVGVRTVRPGRGATTVGVGYPQTMVARLRELVQVNARIELGRRSGPPVIAELRAVTPSHVELRGNADSTQFVPLPEIAWVRRT